jgi:hypothetical protein
MPNISIDYAVLEKAGSEGKVITLKPTSAGAMWKLGRSPPHAAAR